MGPGLFVGDFNIYIPLGTYHTFIRNGQLTLNVVTQKELMRIDVGPEINDNKKNTPFALPRGLWATRAGNARAFMNPCPRSFQAVYHDGGTLPVMPIAP